ncbi:hypothetical protein [Laspinema olomoucense]|uniref:hypothetical protein n=1 Tax=Laspinema olomoucense TaxID=3231600 RepID=UPI0021BBA439|nr:hypothetical protein [Laspinema sp. D3d]MCT7975235.1 hypothetical protein [Laspinema sp. D3d]
MGKLQKLAIALVPIVAITFVVFLALRQIRTDLIQAPGEPDTNTDFWSIKTIEDAETLLVCRGTERRRVKLCGIQPATELINQFQG